MEVEESAITIEELCRRYDVDMAHARHVAEMALALFDLTAEVHGLSAERRDLLETAAILHNVGFAFYPEKHHTAGRDIILDHRLVELGEVEQQMVACTTAFHRKRFKPKRLRKEPSFTALPAEVQDDALALAALIRVADGLDYSQSQTSALGEAERSGEAIGIPVTGFHAGEDAARAQEKADMWHRLFDVQLRFLVEGEPVIWVQPEKKLKAPGVLPDDPMSEAGRKVLRFHFERMLEHEPGTRLGRTSKSCTTCASPPAACAPLSVSLAPISTPTSSSLSSRDCDALAARWAACATWMSSWRRPSDTGTRYRRKSNPASIRC